MFNAMYYWLRAKIKSEKGMEMLQVVLIAGISLVLIVTIFFPKFNTFFGGLVQDIIDWFNGKKGTIFS